MRASPHKPLAWNPKEIAFLGANAALGPGEDTQTLTTVKTRWVYNTLREVFIAPAGYVVKRFSHFPGRKDYRPVWRREHLALQQLSGLSVPRTKGYLKVAHPGGESSVLYLRELVPGTPLVCVDDDQAAAMAYLLHAFHARGVVTLDPQAENFIAVDRDDGALAFIDFGRARCFSPRNPLLYANIGKELLKLKREGGLSPGRYAMFLDAYRSAGTYSRFNWAIIDSSFNFWQQRYARKNGVSG